MLRKNSKRSEEEEVNGMELKKKAEDLLEKQLQLLNQEDLRR